MIARRRQVVPKPPVPVEYASAVRALQRCTTLHESKYWSDKADALAAWSRIYRDDAALLEAKRLKLHAFRRMGELAAELRPGGERGKGKGRKPGPVSLLLEHGFKKHEASAARNLSRVSAAQFSKLMQRPLSPTSVADQLTRREPIWRAFGKYAQMLRFQCRSHTPAQVAAVVRKFGPKRVAAGKALAAELVTWLREFSSRL